MDQDWVRGEVVVQQPHVKTDELVVNELMKYDSVRVLLSLDQKKGAFCALVEECDWYSYMFGTENWLLCSRIWVSQH